MDMLIMAPKFMHYVGGSLHGLTDEIVMAGLVDDLDRECGEYWYAVVPMADGKVTMRGQQDWAPASAIPSTEQRELILELAIRLNKELSFTGHWVVAWTADSRWLAMWRDEDGDVQFIVDKVDPWVRMKEDGIEGALKVAYDAWHHWIEVMQHRLERDGKRQTFKQAQGEKPKSTLH